MKLRRNFPTILIAAVLLPQISIIPLIFTGVLFFVAEGYKSQFVDNARNTANLLATQLSHYDLHAEQNAALDVLKELTAVGQIAYAEIAIDGQSSPLSAANTKAFKEDFFFGQHDDDVYYISLPMFSAKENSTATLQIGFDETPVREQLEVAHTRTIYFAIGLLLITTIVIVITARFLTRPLREIRDAAQQIANQNTNQSLSIPTSIDELSSLSSSLENMRRTTLAKTKQIEAREKYISEIMRNIGDILIVIDHNLDIRKVNKAAEEVFHYKSDELIGKNARTLFDDQLIEILKNHNSTHHHDNHHSAPLQIEVVATSKNRDIIPLEINLAAVDLDDAPIYVLSARDIRIRKQTEEALIQAKRAAEDANQAKSTFLSTMSHELRTPLNAIIGYSDLLLEDITDPKNSAIAKDIGKIKAAGTHLLTLINNILDLSKIEAGRMEVYLTQIDTNIFFEEINTTIKPLTIKNENKFVIEKQQVPATFWNDDVKLRQILFNLIGNANKFTKNGTVTLRINAALDNNPPRIHFDVIDTGVGIPSDKLGRLFQAFSQTDASISNQYGGTGLGLAISKKLCQLLGGDITVESENGKGSTFRVTLPLKLNQD